jgi:hypothetical protein
MRKFAADREGIAGKYALGRPEVNIAGVELRDLPSVTKSITIDVSSKFPDCTGGHTLVVNTK